MLEAELRILDHYEPVLGLPDTRPGPGPGARNPGLPGRAYNTGLYFQAPLISLKEQEPSNWKHLRDVDASNRTYPCSAPMPEGFRQEARTAIQS